MISKTHSAQMSSEPLRALRVKMVLLGVSLLFSTAPVFAQFGNPANVYTASIYVEGSCPDDQQDPSLRLEVEAFHRQIKEASELVGTYTYINNIPLYSSGSANLSRFTDTYIQLAPIDDTFVFLGSGLPGEYNDYFGGAYGFYVWLAVDVDAPVPPVPPKKGCPDPNSPEPINLITGSMLHDETDMVIPCPSISLEFSRSYDSQLNSPNTSLGSKWTHTYNWSLTHTNTLWNGVPNDTLKIMTGDGDMRLIGRATNWSTTAPWIAYQDSDWQVVTNNNNGYVLFAYPEQNQYSFDSNGVLTSISDLWSNSVTLTYTNAYPSNILVRVQHNNGQHLDFQYQGSNLVKVTSPDTNFYVCFSYNANGELINATRTSSYGATSKTYSYDPYANHCLTNIVNANGDSFVYLYGTNQDGSMSSLCTNMTLIGGNGGEGDYYHHTVNYCAASNSSDMTLFRGQMDQTYTYQHDPTNYMITAIYGPSSTNVAKTYSWDPVLLNLTNAVVADGNVSATEKIITRRTFGANHSVISEGTGYCADPTHIWSNTWNNVICKITSMTDPESHETAISYSNDLPSCVSLYYDTSGDAYNTFFSYTTNGLLSGITNANGHWTQYYCDRHGFLTSSVPQLGPAVQCSNNILGFVQSITLPGDTGNRVISFDVDELGQVNKITYPLTNIVETFAFDQIGNMTNYVDAAGRTTSYNYLPTMKLSSVIRHLSSGATISNGISYDNQFNTINLTDAKGRPVESYVLDLQDRVTSVTNLEGQTMTIAYGVANFVKSITRFCGSTVYNSYNQDGLLSQTIFPGSTNAFSYMKNGLLETAANELGAISNSWSFANRLSSSTFQVSGLSLQPSVSYAYYPAGQISNVTSVAGTNTYALDNADRVSSLTALRSQLSSPLTFNYSFNTNNGLVSSMTCTNNGLNVHYAFDVLDRVTSIVWSNSSKVVKSFIYSYNNASMITNIALEDASSLGYSYDDVDRLIEENRSGISNQAYAISYGWDAVGNRIAKTNGSIGVSYSCQSGCNRLTGWNAASTNNFADFLTVDVTGSSSEPIGTNVYLGQLSVTNVGLQGVTPAVSGSTFTANSFLLGAGSNQIVAAIADVAGNVGYSTNIVINQIATNGAYLYHAAGCVTSIIYSGASFTNTTALKWNSQFQLTAVSTNGVAAERNGFDAFGRRVWNWDGTATNYIVYEGVHVLAEVDSTGGLKRAYMHGPGIDNWLAMTVYTGTTVRTYFYMTDHLGSVHAITDSSGAIIESYRYDSWGRVLGVYDANNNPLTQSAIGNRYLWQGREYSWSTGLYFFRARWYDPITGRWLSNDPIGISGGLDQYVFCRDNPVNSSDPFGLADMWDSNMGGGGGMPLQGPVPTQGSALPLYEPVINNPIDGLIHYLLRSGWPVEIGPDLQQKMINKQKQGGLPTTPKKTGCDESDPWVNTALSGGWDGFIIDGTLGQFRYRNDGTTTDISDYYAFPSSQSDWNGGTTHHNSGLSWIPGVPYAVSGSWSTPK
jgi:RHS repeat-associated protein